MIQTFVTWFGCGRLKKAPGTWGTLGAIPLVFLFQYFGPFFYMGLTFLLVLVSIPLVNIYQARTGAQDSPEIVIDEVVGFLITMTWLPLNWKSILLGFLLFRCLDILKPFPIRRIDERVKGGLGVMADDMVAGILANIFLQVTLSYTHWLH